MAKDKSQIYVDAQKLFCELYDAQFYMAKRDQPKMGARLQDHCEQVIAEFELAHDTEGEERMRHLTAMCSQFSILKVELRIVQDKKMIHNNGVMNRIRALIVTMDEGIVKWRNYIYATNGTRESNGGSRRPLQK